LRNGTFLDDAKGLTTVNITGVTGPDGRAFRQWQAGTPLGALLGE